MGIFINNIRYFIVLVISFLFIFNTSNSQDINRFKYNKLDKPLYNVIRVDFTVTTSDNVILDCTRFYPDATPPSGGWPAMIYCHGYGLSKEEALGTAEDLASYGYFTLCYSMRGQGYSGGKSNLISTTEMNDFMTVLNYVKSQPIVKVTRVGASGGSQGGTIPIMAACYNPGILRCVISDVSSPEFATSWIENKSVKMTLLWSLSYDTSLVRYNNQVKAYRNWILSDTPDKWDSLAYYMPINRDFTSKVAQNTTPIIISDVWQDKFFNAYGWIKSIPNIHSSYRMYFGTYYSHGAEYFEQEDNYHDQITNDWAEYWLEDIQNGVLDSAKYIYAASRYPRQNYAWTWGRYYTNTWPPSNVDEVKFYLTANGKMRTVVNTSLPDTMSFFNDIKDTAINMTESVNWEFTGNSFNQKFGKTQIIWETPPLVQDTRMVGTPYVNIHYRSTSDKAQFNFQIYEIHPSYSPYLIARANYTDRKITPNVIRQLSFYGTSHSHLFRAGSKIRIVLTNLDNTEWDNLLRTNPYVLPSLKKARNIIYMNPANQTYVRLPLIGYIPNNISPISNVIPDKFYLLQNYPNPFNPVTNIKFGIPANLNGVNTVLKVYDITGREVKTIMNEELQPGIYEVRFYGSQFNSGVYFCHLTAGNYSEIKKMILLK